MDLQNYTKFDITVSYREHGSLHDTHIAIEVLKWAISTGLLRNTDFNIYMIRAVYSMGFSQGNEFVNNMNF